VTGYAWLIATVIELTGDKDPRRSQPLPRLPGDRHHTSDAELARAG
jgi:hypothetical protein